MSPAPLSNKSKGLSVPSVPILFVRDRHRLHETILQFTSPQWNKLADIRHLNSSINLDGCQGKSTHILFSAAKHSHDDDGQLSRLLRAEAKEIVDKNNGTNNNKTVSELTTAPQLRDSFSLFLPLKVARPPNSRISCRQFDGHNKQRRWKYGRLPLCFYIFCDFLVFVAFSLKLFAIKFINRLFLSRRITCHQLWQLTIHHLTYGGPSLLSPGRILKYLYSILE